MPDDRFGDLDPSERRSHEGGPRGRGRQEGGPHASAEDLRPGDAGRGERSAAERLSELDAGREPAEERRESPAPPSGRTGSRYAWVVGVAVLLLIAVAAINTLPNSGRGREGPEAGRVMPDFAAPSALGDSDADANIRQGTAGSEQEGAVPACEVEGEDVVNVCDLRNRPVMLTFVAPGCEDALDEVERVRLDFPGVNFVGVIIGESREDAADIVAGHEWGFPVALDPDSAVFNLYRAADCPTTVTAEAGGEVVETRNGPLAEDELRDAVEDITTSPGGEV